MRLIKAHIEAPSIRQVDWRGLWTKGVRALLFDLDNTLCLWHTGDFPKTTAVLLRRLQGQGFRIAVLTNARLPKNSPVREALGELGIPLIERAKKPLPFGFRKALRLIGASPSEAAVIGDQLLTDVLGGKLAGLYTVLIPPLSLHEARRTKVNRALERLLGRPLPRR